jgi:hypothetical protein
LRYLEALLKTSSSRKIPRFQNITRETLSIPVSGNSSPRAQAGSIYSPMEILGQVERYRKLLIE